MRDFNRTSAWEIHFKSQIRDKVTGWRVLRDEERVGFGGINAHTKNNNVFNENIGVMITSLAGMSYRNGAAAFGQKRVNIFTAKSGEADGLGFAIGAAQDCSCKLGCLVARVK